MGAIQSAVNQALNVGSLIATQTPEYKAKVAEKETDVRLMKENLEAQKRLEQEKEDINIKSELVGKQLKAQKRKLKKMPIEALGSGEHEAFIDSAIDLGGEKLALLKRTFELNPDEKTYKKYMKADAMLRDIRKQKSLLDALREANSEAVVKADVKKAQKDVILERFKDLKGGKK